ncbi:hypothetical protein [Bradyrhizobium erythrophlei]|jgi:hypothetical protein|uniref:Uncharacterized protein n=1 Tax=Bradyrhizobium erythrophlei TaxID=1437360 RepID=A0A1M5I9J1_9BRAD|nr:hypothetical protein [Bradyrhizobium erythrophlei]SHG24922.1 hypothetical protein SAMN05444169_1399 [Bradyrhizobium erythrophlei]
MKKGDEIIITCGERIVPGEIVMISDNQVSAIISFEALLEGHAGLMPIVRHDKERCAYRSIIDGTEVTLRVKS